MKKIKSKKTIIIIAVVLALLIIGFAGGNTSPDPKTASVETTEPETTVAETTETATTSSPASDYGEDLGSGDYSVKGIKDEVHPQSVRNDTTGSWKYCMIAQSGITAEDYAYNYYKTCFESGDTVHYVVNVSTNTTTCISDLGGLVAVTTTEYVDGEEHDASTLGGGMVLGSWNLYPDTGKMESTME